MAVSSDPGRRRFHFIMAGCGVFVLAALASLVYVCSRPQAPEVRAAERHAVLMCWQRSADAGRTAISRDALATACLEMERQYLRKFGAMP